MAELKKQRNSNLELYRIIVMLLIVAHHYVVNSGLIELMRDNDYSNNSIFLYLFGMWGKTGINCFVMITGYFMCKSEATVHKFMKLLLEVVFYKIIIYLVFLVAGVVSFDAYSCFKALLPISTVGDGFTTAFILFYLTIPFLNVLIRNLNQKSHFLLVCLSIFTYTLWDLVPTIVVHYNYITWFIILYFISSYIRLYPDPKYNSNTSFWAKTTMGLIVIAMMSVLYISYNQGENPFRFVADTNAILALLIGISSFMLFKNLKIKQNKFINTVAASTFGVLLIHANSDAMRQWLWVDTLKNTTFFTSEYLWLHALLSVVGVFTICILIDILRIRFIEKSLFNSAIYKKMIDKISASI